MSHFIIATETSDPALPLSSASSPTILSLRKPNLLPSVVLAVSYLQSPYLTAIFNVLTPITHISIFLPQQFTLGIYLIHLLTYLLSFSLEWKVSAVITLVFSTVVSLPSTIVSSIKSVPCVCG